MKRMPARQIIKEKITQFELDSGSTVCSDARTTVGKGPSGTVARPPPGIDIRLKDFFMPRKMELKGWVPDYGRCSYQGLTETEVSNFIKDLHQMVLDQYRKYRLIGIKPGLNKEHGRPKTWSVCGSAMKLICQRWSGCWTSSKRKDPYKLRGREVSSRLEMSPERTPLAEGPCFVLQRLHRGDVVFGKIQISVFVGSVIAAKYIPEGDGHAGEGWTIKSEVIARICTEFRKALCEVVATSS